MTTSTRCECCDLPVESCGRDAEQQQRLAERQHQLALTVAGYWPAQYPGRCATCGDPFKPNTLVVRVRDGLQAECCA